LCRPSESLGYGGSVVNSKTRVPPGEEKVDAVLGDELAVSKKVDEILVYSQRLDPGYILTA
jgi:hypothetical protein